MTPKQAIHLLVDIVAKGGNLLYNIGPGPDGEWPKGAYKLLDAMGEWIDINGEAIYSTRAIAPFKTDNICLTQQKDTKAVYAIYLEKEKTTGLPQSFMVKGIYGAKNAKLKMLGAKGNLKWKNRNDGIEIFIPKKMRENLPCKIAWAVKISAIK
jgi:alpha-L-fucosidase